ncbi:MAG: hypothetical protein LBR95_07360 [Azoarcus sp.]|nr:hypothetical protein [Azoarcus sp.]
MRDSGRKKIPVRDRPKWFEKRKSEVTANTAESQRNKLAKHIISYIGTLPASEIDATKVLAALEPIPFPATHEA